MRLAFATAFFALLTFAGSTALSAADNGTAQFRQEFLAGKLKWQDVLDRAAAEGQVRFLYWGGNDVLNLWTESAIGPAMEALGITILPNRLTNTRDAVDLVLAETKAGKRTGQGDADLIWLNGENFYTMAQNDLLFGGFAQILPNSDNFDWNPNDHRAHANFWDFGTQIKDREIPWSSEQFVCAVNRRYVAENETPHTFADLKSYLVQNPQKFSYIKPPNGNGSTFVLSALYAFNPDATGAQPFQQAIDTIAPDELARIIAPGMRYLKTLVPLLHNDQNGETHYPPDSKASDNLFREGKIHFTCEFGTYAAATKIATGHYPNTAEAMIFPKTLMIKNKNYLAIPSNAANPAAALVLANYLSSVEAQAGKLRVVGYPTGIDHWMLTDEEIKSIESAAPPHVGVTQAQLDANAVPDTNASLVDIINTVWRNYIEKGSDRSIEELVADAYVQSGHGN
ncbi:MAG: ABC transporter substrate-binding protein [Alphaproteobacteria bacterium]|nr:ABC transporter substrate-binding protein [Alphaproteobacteria bacterium]